MEGYEKIWARKVLVESKGEETISKNMMEAKSLRRQNR